MQSLHIHLFKGLLKYTYNIYIYYCVNIDPLNILTPFFFFYYHFLYFEWRRTFYLLSKLIIYNFLIKYDFSKHFTIILHSRHVNIFINNTQLNVETAPKYSYLRVLYANAKWFV